MLSDVQLSMAVMTHPSRLDAAHRLAGAITGPVTVVVDPQPDGPPSALRTAVRAWSHCPVDTTHHLVLQDDIRLAASFREQATEAARRHPGRLIALYANSTSWNGAAARAAMLAGYGWVATTPDDYFPTLATIMPCAVAHDFATYAGPLSVTRCDDDQVLKMFIAMRGHRTALRVPNLVQHEEQPSLIGNDDQGIRRSVAFPGRLDSATGFSHLESLPGWPAFIRRRALLRMPSRLGGPRWRTLSRTQHLAELRVGWDRIAGPAECVLERLGRPLPERRAAARLFLRELRLAALSLGWVVATVGPHQEPIRRTRRSDVALTSYIEAGLGFDPAMLRWQSRFELLLEFADNAVDEGFALGARRSAPR
jgi:hypothetical protein